MTLVIKKAGFDQYLDPSGGAYIKALVLGEHGQGKTPFAATWPSPIIADCERGVMSVADRGTPFATITCAGDMEALLEFLRKECLKPAASRQFQTLVIDTIDTYQKVIIAEKLRADRKEALSGWADWGWLDGKMNQLIEKVLNLPMHVVVNMHIKDDKDTGADGESEILIKKSSLKGDIGSTVYRFFDLIGLLEASYQAVNGQRTLTRSIRWHAEPKFPMLRDRSHRLPRFTDVAFEESDFTQIFQAITGSVDDLPETEEVMTLETEADTVAEAPTVDPNVTGGPVPNPEIPAAKKATAKKAPAKKAAAKPPKAEPEAAAPVEPEVVAEGTPVDAAPEPEPAEPVTQGQEDVEQAQALLEKELGATPVEDESTPAPTPAPAEPAAKPAVKICGTQAPGMEAHPAVPGCGKELSKANASKLGIAQLRTKTQLCDECYQQFTTTK